jgi:hypothetical protein
VYFSAAPPTEPLDGTDAIRRPSDDRLAALLAAPTDAARDAEIARLLAQLAPVIDGVLAHHCRASRVRREDADDLRAGIVVRVLRKLRAACADPAEAVQAIEDYVATLTRNAVSDFLRARYPERARLKNRIRFLFSNDARFAAWSVRGTTLCGLAAWRGTTAAAPAALPRDGAPRVLFDATRTAEALLALFRLTAAPLELDALITLLMQVWNVAETTAVDIDAAVVIDARPTQLARFETRELLRAAWEEIAALPPLQRTALLLNLRDHEGGSALTLFVLLGVAGIDALAAAAGLPARELAELWSALPLDDASIAARLGATRQQVINLRKSARERLRRRLRMHLPTQE